MINVYNGGRKEDQLRKCNYFESIIGYRTHALIDNKKEERRSVKQKGEQYLIVVQENPVTAVKRTRIDIYSFVKWPYVLCHFRLAAALAFVEM